jgi:hypothetical protein
VYADIGMKYEFESAPEDFEFKKQMRAKRAAKIDKIEKYIEDNMLLEIL